MRYVQACSSSVHIRHSNISPQQDNCEVRVSKPPALNALIHSLGKRERGTYYTASFPNITCHRNSNTLPLFASLFSVSTIHSLKRS